MKEAIKRWWCGFADHNADEDKNHIRRRLPMWCYDKEAYERPLYSERYSECKRCGEEIIYARLVNCWWTKAEHATKHWSPWVSAKDADSINLTERKT